MIRKIKIGTRESELALWQAKFISQLLQNEGIKTELVPIKSEGDINLVSPLYEMGVQGIFTKTLDSALLSGIIDIAVHSLKDVPTQLPQNLCIASIPKRGNWKDILVYKDKNFIPDINIPTAIASSSLRRKSQWLNRYPAHSIVPIRGNINSRLDKLNRNADWDGVIFAAAGIERIHLNVPNYVELDWMLPAPAQGALAVVCRTDDSDVINICKMFNDSETEICVNIERAFLRELMGGCSMPIGAIAQFNKDIIHFKGNILSLDGNLKQEIELEFRLNDIKSAGKAAARDLLANGGKQIATQLTNLM